MQAGQVLPPPVRARPGCMSAAAGMLARYRWHAGILAHDCTHELTAFMVTGTPPRKRRLALRLPSCRAAQTSQQVVFTHAHKLRKSAYRERGLARRRAERNRGQTSESIRTEQSRRGGVGKRGLWSVGGRPRNDESGGISRRSQKRNARHWCTVSDAKMRCHTPSQ